MSRAAARMGWRISKSVARILKWKQILSLDRFVAEGAFTHMKKW
jgi:hypothetical protein